MDTRKSLPPISAHSKPAWNPAPDEKLPDLPKQNPAVVGCFGCMGLICVAIFAMALLGKCSSDKDSSTETNASHGHATFAFTADSFREAFDHQVVALKLNDRFQIQRWDVEQGAVMDTATAHFESDQLGLIATMDKKSGKVRDLSVIASGGNIKTVTDLMLLPLVAVATADPSIAPEKRAEVVSSILSDAFDNKAKAKRQTLGRLALGATYMDTIGTVMFYVEPKQ